jgi:hypothetical protein
MITEAEQKILDNAPEGAVYYGYDIRKDVFYSKSQMANNVLSLNSLADLRKKQGKTVVDAVNHYEAGAVKVGTNGWHIGLMSDNIFYKSELVCSIEEVKQCIKEMAEARWLVGSSCDHTKNIDSGACFFDFEQYKKDYKEQIKPRINVDYVECDNLQYALNDFELNEGVELYRCNDGRTRIRSVKSLAQAYGEDRLFRKVETEIKTEKRWIVIDPNKKALSTMMLLGSERDALSYPNGGQVIEITVEV